MVHLVTIGVLWHPWGPTQWLLGPRSSGHAPPETPVLLFVGCSLAHDVRTNCIGGLPPSTAQKGGFSIFVDILTIHNDQISYVKHVLDPLYVVYTLSGCLERRGGSEGAGAHPAYAVFTLCTSKMEISETDFLILWLFMMIKRSNILCKACFRPSFVFFTLFGCLDGGRGLLNDFLTS